ncbi:hypothetical protein ABIB38_002407 [Massilia sp. UYP11]|uniref:N-acetylmuramoyl-L-alanine amidase n=1 Tax=Massilia sp. UYP11 TaxID=1756385 RepID=UPI003D1A60DF
MPASNQVELSADARRCRQCIHAAAHEFDVPPALLEAIAWAESRWHPPSPQAATHHGLPRSYGIMGLRDDPHFGRSLRLAAALLDAPTQRLALDTPNNIRGAAALLALYGRGRTRDTPLEAWEDAAARLCGILQRDVAQIHTYDIYMAIREGRQGQDFAVTRHPVDLARIYGAARLGVLSARALVLTALADHPDVVWLPAASCNYSGRTLAVSHVTVHTTQGSYAGAISWFRNCSAGVSAHYLVRSSDGQVTQMVRESDKAWHVGSANGHTVGIEHEGFVEQPGAWYSELLASSSLARAILAARGIAPRVYDGSRGWNAVLPDADYNVKGHVNHAGQTHTDPGAGWDWGRYKRMVES